MLLKKVERAVRTKLNVIVRDAEKEFLCTIPYKVEIGGVEFKNRLYLITDTKLIIDNKPFTTFYGHRLYNIITDTKQNPSYYLKCNDETVRIGYVNFNNYLHLPDYLTAQLLYLFKSGVTAVSSQSILVFGEKGVDVFRNYTSVSSPYYLYTEDFEYTYSTELLAKIIGLTDVYKRGLFTKSDVKKYIYFLYPYVSLVLYKRLKTTLYPSYISMVVSEVYTKLKSDVEEVLNEYQKDTAEKIEDVIKEFNSGTKIIVKPVF